MKSLCGPANGSPMKPAFSNSPPETHISLQTQELSRSLNKYTTPSLNFRDYHCEIFLVKKGHAVSLSK